MQESSGPVRHPMGGVGGPAPAGMPSAPGRPMMSQQSGAPVPATMPGGGGFRMDSGGGRPGGLPQLQGRPGGLPPGQGRPGGPPFGAADGGPSPMQGRPGGLPPGASGGGPPQMQGRPGGPPPGAPGGGSPPLQGRPRGPPPGATGGGPPPMQGRPFPSGMPPMQSGRSGQIGRTGGETPFLQQGSGQMIRSAAGGPPPTGPAPGGPRGRGPPGPGGAPFGQMGSRMFAPPGRAGRPDLNTQPWTGGSGGTAQTRSPTGSPDTRTLKKADDPAVIDAMKAKYAVKSAYLTKKKTKISDDESEKQFAEEYTDKGGLKTFKRLVVLNEIGDLGEWTGYSWKSRRGCDIQKIAHDRDGRMWYLDKNNEVGKLMKNGFKLFGHLGNEELIDLAFDQQNKLWGINRMGDLQSWNGFNWDRKNQFGFHKLKAIAFDKKGSLWAVNGACEIAVWDDEENCWDQKEVPGGVRVSTLDFDEKNKLWILGPSDQLMLLSGNHWVNFGWVACWKLKDLSFKK